MYDKIEEILSGLSDKDQALALKWAILKASILKEDILFILAQEVSTLKVLGGDKRG